MLSSSPPLDLISQALNVASPEVKKELFEEIRRSEPQLRKFNYAKHVLTRLEEETGGASRNGTTPTSSRGNARRGRGGGGGSGGRGGGGGGNHGPRRNEGAMSGSFLSAGGRGGGVEQQPQMGGLSKGPGPTAVFGSPAGLAAPGFNPHSLGMGKSAAPAPAPSAPSAAVPKNVPGFKPSHIAP